MTEPEMILVKTDKTLVGRKAYLLEKEANINKRETLLNNPVVEMLETKHINLKLIINS